MFSLLGLGFWLGMRHAADADHVLAVSTIVARTKKLGTAWLLGAFWGLGHTVTIFAVGACIMLLKITIPPRVGLAMEFLVALVLIALGVFNIAGYKMSSLGIRRHAHAHVHELELGWLKRHMKEAGAFQIIRSAVVGLIHGLAGSAAVALLVLATIGEPRTAVFYLLIFGLGTLSGMLFLSAMMELGMVYLARWWRTAEWFLTFGTGLLSLLFGLYTAWDIAFAGGLLGAAPHWNPH